jgi:hypothetical protein
METIELMDYRLKGTTGTHHTQALEGSIFRLKWIYRRGFKLEYQ